MKLLESGTGGARTNSQVVGRTRRTRKEISYHLAVIAGSGMGAVADGFEARCRVPFSEIGGVGDCTVDGHVGQVVMCDCGGVGVMFVLGRRHMYEGAPHAMRHLLRWIRERGVSDLVVASAAGSLSPHVGPGEFVVIRDAIDLQNRPLDTPPSVSLGAELSSPRPRRALRVHPRLTRELEDAAWNAGVGCNRGTLVCLSGPTYETPAEVEMVHRTGALVVTMSAAPEILFANECGMRVAALAAVTNLATGIGHAVPDHSEVLSHAWHMSQQFALVIRQLVDIKRVD